MSVCKQRCCDGAHALEIVETNTMANTVKKSFFVVVLLANSASELVVKPITRVFMDREKLGPLYFFIH